MQLSQKDQFLAEVLPKFTGRLTQLRQIWSNPQTEQLFQRLATWDASMSKDSVEAAIYHVWEHLFHYSLFNLTTLSEFERKSIVNHAFFENYFFLLLDKFANGKLTQEERIVC